MSNFITKKIKEHRSIRNFTRQQISDYVLKDILTSAQWAPSSHNGQAYSIIVVKNESTKKKLSDICDGQKWVITSPVFLVFCIDFYRLQLSSNLHSTDFKIEEIENLLVGSVDAALAAENLLIAARSHGLSGVMMGSIRLDPKSVIDLLELPPLTFPLIGMCLGYPEGDQWQKPRLPQTAVIHEEKYQKDQIVPSLKKYDVITKDYYTKRTNGRKTDGWTKQMASFFSRPQIPYLKDTLLDQGFECK